MDDRDKKDPAGSHHFWEEFVGGRSLGRRNSNVQAAGPPKGLGSKTTCPGHRVGCCRGEQWNPEALDLYGVLECGGQATVGCGGSGTLDHSSSSFFFNTARGSHTGSFLRPPGGSPPLTHVGRNPGKDRLWRAVENTHKKPSKSPFLVWTF